MKRPRGVSRGRMDVLMAKAARSKTAPAPSALPVAAPEPATESEDEPAKTSEGAEVVRLDRFRKK